MLVGRLVPMILAEITVGRIGWELNRRSQTKLLPLKFPLITVLKQMPVPLMTQVVINRMARQKTSHKR